MGDNSQTQRIPARKHLPILNAPAAETANHPRHHPSGGIHLMHVQNALMADIRIDVAEGKPAGPQPDIQPALAALTDLFRQTAVDSVFQTEASCQMGSYALV